MKEERSYSISAKEFDEVYGAEGKRRAESKRKQTEANQKESNETKANQNRSDVAEASANVLAWMIGNTLDWGRNNKDVKVQETAQLEDGNVIDGEIVREW